MGTKESIGTTAMVAVPVVVGISEHNGWAILVSVSANNRKLMVLDRRRVELLDPGLPNQPYHHETLSMSPAEAEELLGKVRYSVLTCAVSAFKQLRDALGAGHQIRSVAIRNPPLVALPDTVAEVHNSRPLMFAADGMLYHNAICQAARDLGMDVSFHRRGSETECAAAALEVNSDRVDNFLRDLGRMVGTPWTKEHRNAAAAAVGVLSKVAELTL